MPLCQPDRGERMGKINSPYALAVLILLVLFSVVSCFQPQTQKIQQSGVYHLVKKNETVPMIAQAYGVSLRDLVQINKIKDVKSVKAGSVLFIPNVNHVIDAINVKKVYAASDVKPREYSSNPVKEPAKNKDVKEIKEVKETKEAGETKEEKGVEEVKEKVEVKKDAEEIKVKEDKTVAQAPVTAVADEVVPVLRIRKDRPPENETREMKALEKNIPEKKYPDKKTELKSTTKKTVENEKIKPDKNRFIWPVRGTVKTVFGIQPNKTYNNWIKIISKPGIKVKAAANGTVIFSSYLKNYGETIIIRHKDNYATVYTHLKKRYVKIDKDVKKGETIALLGEKDETGATYMNFEVRFKGKARNPMLFLP
jgi:lipoprotein NlpD